MSNVDNIELKDAAEILAAKEVEAKATQLIHNWQKEQLNNITTEVIPKYKTQFKSEIKRQKDGEKIAVDIVTEEMLTFIATVMATLAFIPIREQIENLSMMISRFTSDNYREMDAYEVKKPGEKVIIDVNVFFNTAKENMATSLLNELKKLSPKTTKVNKDECSVMGGSNRRNKTTNRRKNRKKKNTKKSKKSKKLKKSKKRSLK